MTFSVCCLDFASVKFPTIKNGPTLSKWRKYLFLTFHFKIQSIQFSFQFGNNKSSIKDFVSKFSKGFNIHEIKGGKV
jgi:hypothetical protein